MINGVILTILILTVIIASISNNPLNTSVALLIVSSMGFFLVKIESGATWFPLILFILFTGGILIIFIILSSILPNENSLKVNIPNLWVSIILTAVICTNMNSIILSNESIGEVNSALSSPLLYCVIVALILTYFFLSIGLNQVEQTPIRSVQCCNKYNFVNCQKNVQLYQELN